jgi:hypothetical protein
VTVVGARACAPEQEVARSNRAGPITEVEAPPSLPDARGLAFYSYVENSAGVHRVESAAAKAFWMIYRGHGAGANLAGASRPPPEYRGFHDIPTFLPVLAFSHSVARVGRAFPR